MSFYDIVMLVVLVGAIGFGWWKGLAWQIASVAAIVVSYIVSVNFREQVAQYIQAAEPWNKIGAMLILFVGTSLVIWIAYAYVTKSMEKMELKGFDRQIGALVGGVTGVLLCMAITMFSVSLLGDQAHESIHDSKLGPHIVRGIHQVHSILPPEIAARFDNYIEHFETGLGYTLENAPAGYQPFQQRQADGSAIPDGANYQGGWSVPNAQLTIQPPSSGQSYLPPNNGSGTSGPGIQLNFGQPPSNQQPPTSPTTNPNNVWQPPKLEIKIDSENLWKGLFEPGKN